MRYACILILVLSLGCIQPGQVMQEDTEQTTAQEEVGTSAPVASTVTPSTPTPAAEPTSTYASPTPTPCVPEWNCTIGSCAGNKRTKTCTDANACSRHTTEELDCNSLSHVVFSEVAYDVPGKENAGEWLRLYNPMDSAINASNWSISDNSGTWNFSAVIKGKSYLAIARNSEGFGNLTGCDADVSGLNRGLNNDGDFLVLRGSSGAEIDFVAWGGGYNNSYPEWSITAKEGMALKRVSPEDTDSVADWISAAAAAC